MLLTRGKTSVMASRKEAPDSLDYFPTPPWATRAFLRLMYERGWMQPEHTVHEPACGEGHMAAVLADFFSEVQASDIHPYGFGEVADYLNDAEKPSVDWVITNPPFNRAMDFVDTALNHPAAMVRTGVAMLVRLAWLESHKRYEFLHRNRPALVALHSERVPMVKGRWDPKARSATAYAWVVWLKCGWRKNTEFSLIPPGQRQALTFSEDFQRFAARAPAPLLEAAP